MERRKLRGRIVEKYGTIWQFCREIGITPTTVTNVLSGKTTPNPLAIIGWCHVLDIPEEEAYIFFNLDVAKAKHVETR